MKPDLAANRLPITGVSLSNQKERLQYSELTLVIALSDWFNPPVIHRIEAIDNVMVTKVRVKILDEEGNILEEGEAIQLEPSTGSGCWEYVSKLRLANKFFCF